MVQDKAPQATILIAAPILTKFFNEDNKHKAEQDAYAKRVHALRLDNSSRRYIVKDMMTALTEADLRDAYHPNESGHKKMAQVWYDAVNSYC